MKSKFLFFFILLFFSKVSALENLDIKSREISIDKKNEITIFKNEVIIKDEMNNIIKSDYVLYNNILKRLDIKGQVQVMTVEGNLIESENIVLDKKKNILISTSPSIITDIQKNKIKVDNFEYKLSVHSHEIIKYHPNNYYLFLNF